MVRPPPKVQKTHTHTNTNKMQTSHAAHNHTHPQGGWAYIAMTTILEITTYTDTEICITIDTYDNPIPRDYQQTRSLITACPSLLHYLLISDTNVSSQFGHPCHSHINIRTLQLPYQMTRAKSSFTFSIQITVVENQI